MLAEDLEINAVRVVHVIGVRGVQGERIILERVEAASQRPVFRHVECHFPGIDAAHGRLVGLIVLYRRHAIVPLLWHHREHQADRDDPQYCGKDLVAGFQPEERAHRDEPQQSPARLTAHGGNCGENHGGVQPGTQPDVRRCELQITKQRNSHDQGESHLVVAPDEAALRPSYVVNAAMDDRKYAPLDAIETNRKRYHPYELLDPLLALHQDHRDIHHQQDLPDLIQMRPGPRGIHRIERGEQQPPEEDQQKYRLAGPRNFLRLTGDEQ